MINDLIIFDELFFDDEIKKCIELTGLRDLQSCNQFTSLLIKFAEKYNLDGNLFQSLITYLIVNNENTFTLTLERKKEISKPLYQAVLADLEIIYDLFNFEFLNLTSLQNDLITNFTLTKPIANMEIIDILKKLQDDLVNAKNVEEFYHVLKNHFYTYGVGKYGLNKAFRYENNEIQSIIHIGNNKLNHLIGYQLQKEKLIKNTEAFLAGKKANNVLLYGDSGTGKSSSIKALLNEYYKDGLRMVEVYKHQFKYLPNIIQELQSRNYRFIIFMDDLSFEDFEIEYKYLKAVIEGGLEKKPDNILIYATSNRRHLIKQSWSDRTDNDEVNMNDAMQEKLSLASRFGETVLFTHPDRDQYLAIVDGLAQEYKLDMDRDLLHEEALIWEIRHGGFSGRVAKQFINAMIGKK